MNINFGNLANHICFSNIFDSNKNEDGSYNWVKISMCKDLPTSFIDKYFFQMYHFHKLELNENLPEFIIDKYANYLNWNLMLNSIDISEKLLEKYIDKYNMKICLRTQKISFDFLIKHKDILSIQNIKDLSYNVNVSDQMIADFENLFE